MRHFTALLSLACALVVTGCIVPIPHRRIHQLGVRGRIIDSASREPVTNAKIEGSGDPLVLVPGMDGTGQLFYRQVPLLARSFRTATYALRSDAPAMETLVDDKLKLP